MTYPFLTWASLVFTFAVVAAHLQDGSAEDWTYRPISHFFWTASSVVQATMFVVMALSLFHTALDLGLTFTSFGFFVGGLALILTMATDTWPSRFWDNGRTLHFFATGLVFVSGIVAMISVSSITYLLAYLLVPLLLFLIDRQHLAVLEKVSALMLVIWIFGFSLGLA